MWKRVLAILHVEGPATCAAYTPVKIDCQLIARYSQFCGQARARYQARASIMAEGLSRNSGGLFAILYHKLKRKHCQIIFLEIRYLVFNGKSNWEYVTRLFNGSEIHPKPSDQHLSVSHH